MSLSRNMFSHQCSFDQRRRPDDPKRSMNITGVSWGDAANVANATLPDGADATQR
jgi:hypothetical protein